MKYIPIVILLTVLCLTNINFFKMNQQVLQIEGGNNYDIINLLRREHPNWFTAIDQLGNEGWDEVKESDLDSLVHFSKIYPETTFTVLNKTIRNGAIQGN